MSCRLLVSQLCLAAVVRFAVAEVFTAMADMEALLHTEKEIVTIIDQYIAQEMVRLQRLKDFAREYQVKNQNALRDGSVHLSNPVNAYLVVKRLTSDWSYVESLMKTNAAETFLQNVTIQRDAARVRFPDNEDLTGAAVALLRLQDTYQLPTADIASGNIQGVPRANELSGHDCFELGRVAYNQGDFYHTLLWMQEAWDRVQHEDPPTANKPEVLEYLAYAMYQQGNMKRALQLTELLMEIDPMHPRAAGNLKYYADQVAQAETQADPFKKGDDGDIPVLANKRKDDGSVPERETYEALCRGEFHPTPVEEAKLYCHYKVDHPFLRLAPLKVEIVHWRPKVVVFRQVITDAEVEAVKQIALPRLRRALVQHPETGELVTTKDRTAKSAWIKPSESEVVMRLTKRTALATGLNMDTAEDLQIANYGIGGHYDPHYDFARKEEKNAFKGLNTGNRIATMLFYMSAPDAGGATVFPDIKLALFPTKNDAAFWFNLYKSGEGDLSTRHAACPVLSGIKWVSNRWIHEYGQEFIRPCSLDEFEYE